MADLDTKDFNEAVKRATRRVEGGSKRGILDIALEILRLSQFQVPHDTGMLQNSGQVEPTTPADEIIVGYNRVYAARLHENPQFRFQKGRKGKYLEDPIKHNLHIFGKFVGKSIQTS